jgi:hypothetical protein
VFGCLAHYKIEGYLDKSAIRAIPGIFVGIPAATKGWSLWIPSQQEATETSHPAYTTHQPTSEARGEGVDQQTLEQLLQEIGVPDVLRAALDNYFKESTHVTLTNMPNLKAADVPVPHSLEDIVGSPHEIFWTDSVIAELTSLFNLKTFKRIQRKKGMRVIGTRFVFKVKSLPSGFIEKFKSRLVVLGYRMIKGVDYKDTYSPVMRPSSLRIIIHTCAHYKIKFNNFDVMNTYVNADMKEDVVVSIPGLEGVFLLQGSLYGAPQACLNWHLKLRDTLITAGFQQSLFDPGLFFQIRPEGTQLVGEYIDDLPTCLHNPELLTKPLSTQLKVTGGPTEQILGINVEQCEKEIRLSARKNIMESAKKHGLEECKRQTTPGTPVIDHTTGEVESKAHRSVVGSCMHPALYCRPDVSHAVRYCSQFSHRANTSSLKATKKVLKYLISTKDDYLAFNGDMTLTGYVDADYANDQLDRRSITGYVFFLGKSLISWKSKKQGMVPRLPPKLNI